MEEHFNTLLIAIIGGIVAWIVYKRVTPGDGPRHEPWGNWNTTYNAPPVYPIKQQVYLYPFYKGYGIVE